MVLKTLLFQTIPSSQQLYVVDTIIILILHMTKMEACRESIRFLTQSSYSYLMYYTVIHHELLWERGHFY